MKKPLTFTHEIFNNRHTEVVESIEYNKEGIVFWTIWSEHFSDWIPQNLEWLKTNWPGAFHDLESELIAGYDQKYLEYIADSGTDLIRDL